MFFYAVKPRKPDASHAASVGDELGCADSPTDLRTLELKEKQSGCFMQNTGLTSDMWLPWIAQRLSVTTDNRGRLNMPVGRTKPYQLVDVLRPENTFSNLYLRDVSQAKPFVVQTWGIYFSSSSTPD